MPPGPYAYGPLDPPQKKTPPNGILATKFMISKIEKYPFVFHACVEKFSVYLQNKIEI
jgi:hypothetical protein